MPQKDSSNSLPDSLGLIKYTLPGAVAFLLEKLMSYENPQPNSDNEPGVDPITHLPRQQD